MSNNAYDWELPEGYDIMTAESVMCDCGSIVYESLLTLKRVPAEVSPTGEKAVVPIPIFKCSSCGKLNQNYHQK